MDADSRNRTAFIRNLNHNVTEDILSELFVQAGPVENVSLKDGFAFVIFEDIESVPYACALLNDVPLYGAPLVVKPRNGGIHDGHQIPEVPPNRRTIELVQRRMQKQQHQSMQYGYSQGPPSMAQFSNAPDGSVREWAQDYSHHRSHDHRQSARPPQERHHHRESCPGGNDRYQSEFSRDNKSTRMSTSSARDYDRSFSADHTQRRQHQQQYHGGYNGNPSVNRSHSHHENVHYSNHHQQQQYESSYNDRSDYNQSRSNSRQDRQDHHNSDRNYRQRDNHHDRRSHGHHGHQHQAYNRPY